MSGTTPRHIDQSIPHLPVFKYWSFQKRGVPIQTPNSRTLIVRTPTQRIPKEFPVNERHQMMSTTFLLVAVASWSGSFNFVPSRAAALRGDVAKDLDEDASGLSSWSLAGNDNQGTFPHSLIINWWFSFQVF